MVSPPPVSFVSFNKRLSWPAQNTVQELALLFLLASVFKTTDKNFSCKDLARNSERPLPKIKLSRRSLTPSKVVKNSLSFCAQWTSALMSEPSEHFVLVDVKSFPKHQI